MILPTAESLIPCLTSHLSSDTRVKWKKRYQTAKKYGIRAAFSGVSATGLISLAKEAAGDGIKRHGKRYMGGILVNVGLTSLTGGLPLLTNAMKIVKYSRACHSICAATWRGCHNIAELPLIVVDYVIFGEYIPSCGESDYDLFSNTTDVLNQFVD